MNCATAAEEQLHGHADLRFAIRIQSALLMTSSPRPHAMYRVPDLRRDRSFLSEISPLIAAATEEAMSEDEAAEDEEDEEGEEDEEDDEDVARMILLVRAAYKYLRANVDMEKFHKSVGYQLVLAQLKGWTGRVLQGFKWKRDSPELLLFFLALAIQIGKQKYNTLHGPGQPRSDGGRSVFSLDNTVLLAPTYETLTAYLPRTTEKPGFATEANCDELDEQWRQKMGDLPRVVLLVIDGALIRLMLAFCKRSMRFLGLADGQQPSKEEISGCALVEQERYATQVMQMMVLSLDGSIQIEFGFDFMSKSLDAAKLARSIFEAIERLEQRGYLALGLIGDGEGVIIKTRSEVEQLMTTGPRCQDVFLDIYCDEHLWKILRNALLKLQELFAGGWYFNMQTLGTLAFSDVPEIRQLFKHLRRTMVFTDDKMNTKHATVTLSMETVKGLREVLRRMAHENLTLPDVIVGAVEQLLEYVSKMEFWRTVFKDNASLHHAIAAGEGLLAYLEGNLDDIAEARADTHAVRGGAPVPTVRANAVSGVALNGVRRQLEALRKLEILVETDPRLKAYMGLIRLDLVFSQNGCENTFSEERQKNKYTDAVLYTSNAARRQMRRRCDNSGAYPVARRRESSASYAHVADTVHTSVALNRHNKKRRVTNDEPGSAPVEEVQCSMEQIKAFTVANHAERKDFAKTYNIREHRFPKADADTKPQAGRGKRAATMQPNAGPDDTEGCGVPGCKEKLAFTDVCDANGRFIPNRGYGNRDSKRRLPDTVMVFCERPGCGMATHL